MSRIIICGKGGSGKDFLRDLYVKKGFIRDISITTRPPRENEQHGVDYHFVSSDEFLSCISTGYFYEWDQFNGWYYGTSQFAWNESQIFIMTPGGIAKIKPEDRKNSLVIYRDVCVGVRMDRLYQRSDSDSMMRRVEVDEKDFANFTDFDIRLTEPNL